MAPARGALQYCPLTSLLFYRCHCYWHCQTHIIPKKRKGLSWQSTDLEIANTKPPERGLPLNKLRTPRLSSSQRIKLRILSLQTGSQRRWCTARCTCHGGVRTHLDQTSFGEGVAIDNAELVEQYRTDTGRLGSKGIA